MVWPAIYDAMDVYYDDLECISYHAPASQTVLRGSRLPLGQGAFNPVPSWLPARTLQTWLGDEPESPKGGGEPCMHHILYVMVNPSNPIYEEYI